MQEPINKEDLVREIGSIILVFVFSVFIVGVLDYLGLISQ